MTNFQILSNQIVSDFEILAEDYREGLYDGDSEGITQELKRINAKLKLWKKEAEEIIKEAEMIDFIENSMPEQMAERSFENHNKSLN